MDWWRMAELGLPLLVTILLAWLAVHVETKRSRNDRRETWRYERNRAAVDAVIDRMRQASASAKMCRAASSIDTAFLQHLDDVTAAVVSLSFSDILTTSGRLAFEKLLETLPNNPVKADGTPLSPKERLDEMQAWCRDVTTACAAVEHSLSEDWAREGENWGA